MDEEAHHLHNFQADYHRLVNDSKESEVVIKSTEQVITTAQASIAKAQALIEVNEQKLTVARKRLEELEAAKKQVQEDLAAHSSRFKSLQTQLVTKRFLSEDELQAQSWAEVEMTCQQEMQRLRERIYSLTEQDYYPSSPFVFSLFFI